MDNIISYLSHLPDDIKIIFNIGTNNGDEIKHLLNRWNDSRIICFEPIKSVYNDLTIIYGDKIEAHCLALSDKTGYCSFYESNSRNGKNHTGSSSLRKPKEHLLLNPDVTFNHPYKVKCDTLDNFCVNNNISKIDFVWMDAQGSECDIIKSGNLIKNAKYIYTEAYENEMYEGQGVRTTILSLLPNFSVIDINDKYNILLKNMGICE